MELHENRWEDQLALKAPRDWLVFVVLVNGHFQDCALALPVITRLSALLEHRLVVDIITELELDVLLEHVNRLSLYLFTELHVINGSMLLQSMALQQLDGAEFLLTLSAGLLLHFGSVDMP